jgi:hypothetical protein
VTTPAKIAADAMIKLVGFMLPPKIFFQTSKQFPVRTKFNVLPSPPGLDSDAFYATDHQFQEYR